MDPKHKQLLDGLFKLHINAGYGFPRPKLPDNPKEAYECYSKLLKKKRR